MASFFSRISIFYNLIDAEDWITDLTAMNAQHFADYSIWS